MTVMLNSSYEMPDFYGDDVSGRHLHDRYIMSRDCMTCDVKVALYEPQLREC